MNGLKWITTIAIAALVCDAARAADPVARFKVATILPRGTSGHQTLLEMSAQWRPAGVNPTLYTDGVMGGEAEIVRRMRIDQLQGGLLTVAGLTEIDHSVTALQLMPMVFRSLDEAAYVRDRLRPLLEKRLEEKGFVMLFWADAGWVQFFSKKPVLHPDDLRKQKTFVLGSDNSQADLMKAASFQAVPLEYTDILTGLQTGLIEAVPTAPFYALAGQFYLAAPYMLEMNYTPLVGGLVVTRKAWESTPVAARDSLRRSAEEAGKKISLQSRQEMRESIAAMQKRGLKVTQMTPPAEAEWRALFDSMYPKIRGTLVPNDLFDEVQRLLREYRK
jgi:TRAP-type C4-dicarboxylate transport system substrate-binding protein